MMGRKLCLLLACAVLISGGCTRVVVHKNPRPIDRGIRYYRPKPYLFITPGETEPSSAPSLLSASTTVKQNSDLSVKLADAQERGIVRTAMATDELPQPPNGGASLENLPRQPHSPEDIEAPRDTSAGKKISISLVNLPDFAEEYSIQLKPGLGVGELQIQLEDGWNLTSVGIKTDQQTDEIISATGDLVSALAPDGVFGSRSGIKATNIPFGFYEAVIATDPCGVKQLYGWRYIGFMPFQACPTRPCGMQQVACDDPNIIYGLVWGQDGVMRFERIGMIDAQMPE